MNTRGRGKKAKEPDPLPPHEEEEIEADEGKAARFSRTSIQHRYWLLEAEAANNFTTAKYGEVGAKEAAIREELLRCRSDDYPNGVSISRNTIHTQIDAEIVNKDARDKNEEIKTGDHIGDTNPEIDRLIEEIKVKKAEKAKFDVLSAEEKAKVAAKEEDMKRRATEARDAAMNGMRSPPESRAS